MELNSAVIAIGGNSLIVDPRNVTIDAEYEAARETCEHIAGLVADGWQVIIGHGNGPQVGFNLRRSELAAHELFELPLDVCGTFTQGSIGYYLQQNLVNIFRRRGLDRRVVTVVTQTEVDPDDPAFERPNKPIGMFLSRDEARRLQLDGWEVMEDAGRGWRRVVASPQPVRIVEEEIIRALVEMGTIVIAGGGGGIPVAPDANGDLRGVKAVVDKDYASALLANRLGVPVFIISTAVPRVALNFGTPEQQDLARITATEARLYLAEGHFAEGSMAPKIRAVLSFLENGGRRAIITNPPNLTRAVAGTAGTEIVP
jgi:carbamate kinase